MKAHAELGRCDGGGIFKDFKYQFVLILSITSALLETLEMHKKQIATKS